jgi:hypothetical protein
MTRGKWERGTRLPRFARNDPDKVKEMDCRIESDNDSGGVGYEIATLATLVRNDNEELWII